MGSGGGCYKLYVYPDGFYTADERLSGMEPWAVLELCTDGRLRLEAGSEAYDIDLAECLKAMEELRGSNGVLLDYDKLLARGGLEKLLGRCGSVEAVLLASALYASRHRTLDEKLVDALVKVARHGHA